MLFLASMPLVFLSFALPLRAKELGASAFEVGVLFSVFTLAMLLVRPLVGVGLDRFGRRGFLIGALLLHVLTSALYAMSETLLPLYVARLFQGSGLACLLIAADTITADLTVAQTRSAGMGGVMESQARGGIAGALLGFSLVGAVPLHAWSASFATFTLVAALATALAWQSQSETLQRGEGSAWRVRFDVPLTLRRLLVVVFVVAFANALVQPLYLIYLQERFGLELRELALVFVPVGIAYAALPSRLGRWTGSLERAQATALGLLVAGLLYASVPLLASLAPIVCVFVGAAIGSILATLTQNAWVADLVDEAQTGRAYALVQLAAGVGAVLGPLIGGAAYETLGSNSIFYANGVGLLVAAALAITFVPRPGAPSPSRPA